MWRRTHSLGNKWREKVPSKVKTQKPLPFLLETTSGERENKEGKRKRERKKKKRKARGQPRLVSQKIQVWFFFFGMVIHIYVWGFYRKIPSMRTLHEKVPHSWGLTKGFRHPIFVSLTSVTHLSYKSKQIFLKAIEVWLMLECRFRL